MPCSFIGEHVGLVADFRCRGDDLAGLQIEKPDEAAARPGLCAADHAGIMPAGHRDAARTRLRAGRRLGMEAQRLRRPARKRVGDIDERDRIRPEARGGEMSPVGREGDRERSRLLLGIVAADSHPRDFGVLVADGGARDVDERDRAALVGDGHALARRNRDETAVATGGEAQGAGLDRHAADLGVRIAGQCRLQVEHRHVADAAIADEGEASAHRRDRRS